MGTWPNGATIGMGRKNTRRRRATTRMARPVAMSGYFGEEAGAAGRTDVDPRHEPVRHPGWRMSALDMRRTGFGVSVGQKGRLGNPEGANYVASNLDSAECVLVGGGGWSRVVAGRPCCT